MQALGAHFLCNRHLSSNEHGRQKLDDDVDVYFFLPSEKSHDFSSVTSPFGAVCVYKKEQQPKSREGAFNELLFSPSPEEEEAAKGSDKGEVGEQYVWMTRIQGMDSPNLSMKLHEE